MEHDPVAAFRAQIALTRQRALVATHNLDAFGPTQPSAEVQSPAIASATPAPVRPSLRKGDSFSRRMETALTTENVVATIMTANGSYLPEFIEVAKELSHQNTTAIAACLADRKTSFEGKTQTFRREWLAHTLQNFRRQKDGNLTCAFFVRGVSVSAKGFCIWFAIPERTLFLSLERIRMGTTSTSASTAHIREHPKRDSVITFFKSYLSQVGRPSPTDNKWHISEIDKPFMHDGYRKWLAQRECEDEFTRTFAGLSWFCDTWQREFAESKVAERKQEDLK